MIKTISRFFFGKDNEVPEDVSYVEVLEEGWLIVTHKGVAFSKQDPVLPEKQQPTSYVHDDIVPDLKHDCDAVTKLAAPPRRVVTLAQLEAFIKKTQLSCIPTSKPWVDRHQVSRNAMKRQNQVRRATHQNSFHLHQPGNRGCSH